MREVIACPACGRTHNTRVAVEAGPEARARFHAFAARKFPPALAEAWRDFPLVIRRCGGCDHHWYQYQPEPAALGAMYAGARQLRSEPVSREPARSMLLELQRLRRLLPCSEPDLLDFGSGFGRWARAGVATGFRVTAYEPSAQRGEEDANAGFELVHDLETLQGRRFDAINVEQVLEHVSDPVETLSGLRAFCNRTIVRVTVPNIDRTPEGAALWSEWPFDGQRAHTMAPFEHLHGFSARSLRATASRAGFVLIGIVKALRYSPAHAARRVLGRRLLPRVSTTKVFLRPRSGP